MMRGVSLRSIPYLVYCIHAFYTHVLILYCLCGFIVNKVVVLEQDDLKCQLVRIQLQYVRNTDTPYK